MGKNVEPGDDGPKKILAPEVAALRIRADEDGNSLRKWKDRLKKLTDENLQLKQDHAAAAIEQEDTYFSLQRRLDDNYERITELERAIIKVEVDLDVANLHYSRDTSASEAVHKQDMSDANRALSEAEADLRRVRKLEDTRITLTEHISTLEKQLVVEHHEHMQACLAAERIYVRAKEESKAGAFVATRLTKRDITRRAPELFLQRAAEASENGAYLVEGLEAGNKAVQALVERCDRALREQRDLKVQLELLDGTGAAVTQRLRDLTSREAALRAPLNHGFGLVDDAPLPPSSRGRDTQSGVLPADGDEGLPGGLAALAVAVEDGDSAEEDVERPLLDLAGGTFSAPNRVRLLEEQVRAVRNQLEARRARGAAALERRETAERRATRALDIISRCAGDCLEDMEAEDRAAAVEKANARHHHHRASMVEAAADHVTSKWRRPWTPSDPIPSSFASPLALHGLLAHLAKETHHHRLALRGEAPPLPVSAHASPRRQRVVRREPSRSTAPPEEPGEAIASIGPSRGQPGESISLPPLAPPPPPGRGGGGVGASESWGWGTPLDDELSYFSGHFAEDVTEDGGRSGKRSRAPLGRGLALVSKATQRVLRDVGGPAPGANQPGRVGVSPHRRKLNETPPMRLGYKLTPMGAHKAPGGKPYKTSGFRRRSWNVA